MCDNKSCEVWTELSELSFASSTGSSGTDSAFSSGASGCSCWNKASTDYSLQPPTAVACLPTCFHMFPLNPSLSHVADLMDSFWWIEQVMLLDNKDDYLFSKKMSSNNILPSGSWALSCLLKWLIRNWLSFLFWNFRLLLVEKNDGRKWMKQVAPLQWHMATHGTLEQEPYTMQELRILYLFAFFA